MPTAVPSSTPESSSAPALVVAGVEFGWPDGTSALPRTDLALGPGRTGLVGLNGSGKSTLLKLIAGELTPASGSVRVDGGPLGYLPQDLNLAADTPVDAVLGIAERRAALHAIESGDASEENFSALGDDWDVEERALAELGRLGLGATDAPGLLDRSIGELSGGETVLLGLAGQLLRRPAPAVLLLDEPTNNLDRAARERLYAAVRAWRGVLLVVSHDRELLGMMDRIAELRPDGLRLFGGDFDAYQSALEAEQEAAERAVRNAEGDLRREKRDLQGAHTRNDRRAAYGRKMQAQKREPKIVMGNRKRAAQVTAAKQRDLHQGKVREAADRLTEAESAVRDDDEIRVDLPDTAVPPGRTVLTAEGLRLPYGRGAVPEVLDLRGPERVALVGPNGAGKTTLLRLISGQLTQSEGELKTWVPVRTLPQRLDGEVLDDRLSVAANVARYAPAAGPTEIRGRLARFLFRGARADRPVGELSGGERFRAALAALLLADPAPQLLLLDEPTNNLDLSSVRQLTEALRAYRGALIVVSHDEPFLADLELTSRWEMEVGEAGC
jgi:ATPase subunit of ABC transporter with duplicated ATPase domains